jgi:DNA polymerase III subunit epsilon
VSSSAEETFVAFDLETTGLFPGVHRIAEIGAVRFTRQCVLGRWQTLVDPGVPMSEEAGRVNGITDEMLRGQPPIREVLPAFLDFMAGAVPVAHNAPFDAGFLAAAAAEEGLHVPETPVLDTRVLARAAFPGRWSYALDALRRSLGLDAAGAGSAGDGAGLETAHRAAGDAEACRRLFLLCAGELEGRGMSGARALAALRAPGARLPAGGPPGADRVAELNQALQDGGDLEITYLSARGERTVRRITPLSLLTVGGELTVEAFCHLRAEKRTFRLSQIQELRRPAG